MRCLPYQDIGFAKVDTQRFKRRGYPEVIYCPGKTNSQIRKISQEILNARQDLLLSRITDETFRYLKQFYPKLKLCPSANLAYIKNRRLPFKKGYCLVITAGTSDIPVAEEAVATLEIMGNRVRRIYDAGVAGVHRILDKNKILRRAKVIIVVAGMEGALASVVCGLVRAPVIAVPTSCGYGANFKGISALLTMLNSCSPGVSVVNIDNGFGAGYFASLINK